MDNSRVAQNTWWKLEAIFGGTDNGVDSKTRSIKSKKTTPVASFGEGGLIYFESGLDITMYD